MIHQPHDIDGDLSPEWRCWIDMASEAVIRHMNGGYLNLIPFHVAVQRVKREQLPPRRHRSAEFNETTPRRVTKAKTTLTARETQIVSGIELGLSSAAIARNLKVSEEVIDALKAGLVERGAIMPYEV